MSLFNPVQTGESFAEKLEGLAHALDSAPKTVVIELPVEVAAEAPAMLRAAANALKNLQA